LLALIYFTAESKHYVAVRLAYNAGLIEVQKRQRGFGGLWTFTCFSWGRL